jgi:long-chain acyl-CoA synthetase
MSNTFPSLLLSHASSRGQATALREKDYGIWKSYSWTDVVNLSSKIAAGLHCQGIQKGEQLIIVGNNRPRLYACLLAAQSLGVIPVPLYSDAVSAEYLFPIQNASVRFCIAEDQEQVDKLLDLEVSYSGLKHIYFDDPRGLGNYHNEKVCSLDSLIFSGDSFLQTQPDFFQSSIASLNAQDTAAIFYTSGTTGVPKGVVHTHQSLIDRAKAGQTFDRLSEKEEVLAYLPLAWIGQNIFSYAQWLVCGYTVNCPESSETISIDMREIGPTYYFAPPRIFESMLTSITIKMEDANALKRKLYSYFIHFAARVGQSIMNAQPVSLKDRLIYGIGDLCVYGPLRNILGLSRVRVAYTAGEAIGPDLFNFFRSIGVNLKQLYGSTETAVFVCLQPDSQAKSDTVGIACAGVELQINEQGEVLVRSPGLFKEYYKNQEASTEVLDAEGWYHTRDAGFIDAQGHLKIIDRVKDVGRIGAGQFKGALFAPKYIENKLKFFPFVKEAVAFGDARQSVCCFINIDFEAVGNWAERRSLAYAGYTDLSQLEQVRELVLSCVEKVNFDLSQDTSLTGSQISRFLILPKELDADEGELTRTNKVRRNFIAEKYALLVHALYSELSEQFFETQVKFEDGQVGRVSALLKITDACLYPPQGRTTEITRTTASAQAS